MPSGEKNSDLPSRYTTVVRAVLPPYLSNIEDIIYTGPIFKTKIAHMLGRRVPT